jgi:hypothetical protein
MTKVGSNPRDAFPASPGWNDGWGCRRLVRMTEDKKRVIPAVGQNPTASPNNSLEKITKTTLGKMTMTKLGSIPRDAFPHRLDGMTESGGR